MIFDKQIHKNDFRLRILVTNGCNKNCYHCLNDFQKKPISKPIFLNLNIAKHIIKDYCSIMKEKAQVEFSGGEPGIYPHLTELVSFTKKFKPFIKINTNGTALDLGIDSLVDCWHVGALYPDRDTLKAINGQIQIVVTEKNLEMLDKIVSYYGEYRIPIKLFTDFFSNKTEVLRKHIEEISQKYPSYVIKSRYTGIQENKGKLCNGCTKKCITAKALWVFPDGTISPCPQRENRDGYIGASQIIEAYEGHLYNL